MAGKGRPWQGRAGHGRPQLVAVDLRDGLGGLGPGRGAPFGGPGCLAGCLTPGANTGKCWGGGCTFRQGASMVAYIQGFVKAYSAMYNLPQPNFNSHQAEFHRERSELKAIGFPRF